MNIKLSPAYTGKTIQINVKIDIMVTEKLKDIVSVTLTLTGPKNENIFVANNDIHYHSKADKNFSCWYPITLKGIKSGKYIITVTIISEGRLVEIGREVFELECNVNEFFLIRNPNLCWREESDSLISVFDINGNLLFLRGRLKKLWQACDGKKTNLEVQSQLHFSNSEIDELIQKLCSKGILVSRFPIKIMNRGNVYGFN